MINLNVVYDQGDGSRTSRENNALRKYILKAIFSGIFVIVTFVLYAFFCGIFEKSRDEIEKLNSESGQVAGGEQVLGEKYVPDEDDIVIHEKVYDSSFESRKENDSLIGKSELSDLSGMTDDVYVVYDGVTVVLGDTVLKSFLRSSCPGRSECAKDVPCVDVSEVRSYIHERFESLIRWDLKTGRAENRNGSFEYLLSDLGPDMGSVVDGLTEVLSLRAEMYVEHLCAERNDVSDPMPERNNANESDIADGLDEITNIVKVSKIEVPGTTGDYSDRYIEIDDSQQRLYVWENGKLVRTYEVSGFYDEYAVYGVFKIHNKSLNAWSPVAEKWMPFWMAFHYDAWQDAWLGIHELVYWTDDNGIYHEESSDSIGNKKSGGCVRLDRGEAEELYSWAQVEDPVLIHR